jgi:hypothetical protein
VDEHLLVLPPSKMNNQMLMVYVHWKWNSPQSQDIAMLRDKKQSLLLEIASWELLIENL